MTNEELLEELRKDNVETRRHVSVEKEDMLSEVKRVAEGHADVMNKLDKIDQKVDVIGGKIDSLDLKVMSVDKRVERLEKDVAI